MHMKKIWMLLCLLAVSLSADARVPDFPDFVDAQGLLYKMYRDDISGNELPGHEGEVKFWGIDDRYGDVAERFKAVKVFTVPATMKGDMVGGTGKDITMRVTAIDGNAFSGMPNLEEVIVSEGITYINPFALNSKTLKIIRIPSTVKNLYFSNFNFFQAAWEKVIIAKNHPTLCDIDGVVYNKEKTVLHVCPIRHRGKITIPATVTTIDDNAFEDVATIGTITLPNGVVAIGKDAFYKSSITSLTLPATLKKMGKNALNYCKELKTIRCKASTPPTVEEDHLWGLKLEELTVYIPKGSLKTYQKADWWKHITNFVEE